MSMAAGEVRSDLQQRCYGRAERALPGAGLELLFADRDPRGQLDVLASDLERSNVLELALLERGVYVLPNVRRFVSGVHGEDDLAETLEILDAACRSIE